MDIFKCNKCGNVIELLNGNINNIKCCDEITNLIKTNVIGDIANKHLPVCEIIDDTVIVKVGNDLHPMDNDHYIMWISCEYEDSTVKYVLNPGDTPSAYFDYEKGMTIYAYCNKHGLWKKQL